MLSRSGSGEIRLWFEGRELRAQAHDTVAAALLSHGIQTTRATARSGVARGPYCMMGACFECLAVIDGRSGIQTCLTPVRDGMRVERQNGALTL